MDSFVVWVSGASSGIGKALIGALPWQQGKVIGISRRGLGSAPTLEADVTYEDLHADLSHPEGWEAVRSSFTDELKHAPVDRAVFVHGAATVGPLGFAGEVDAAAYQQAIILNTVAPQVLGEAFVRAVNGVGPPDTRGLLVMLSSGAGSIYPGWSAYKPGKAAVDEWVRSVGAEQASGGGRCQVVSITPGLVETPMQEALRNVSPDDFPEKEKFVDANEAGDVRPPEDVARQIWGLAEGDLENGAVLDLRDLT